MAVKNRGLMQTIEAQYYKRKGADSKTQRVARAATGAAFLAWIINAAWTAGVNFLVNLAKKKGANYRDDEDELTAQSVHRPIYLISGRGIRNNRAYQCLRF